MGLRIRSGRLANTRLEGGEGDIEGTLGCCDALDLSCFLLLLEGWRSELVVKGSREGAWPFTIVDVFASRACKEDSIFVCLGGGGGEGLIIGGESSKKKDPWHLNS